MRILFAFIISLLAGFPAFGQEEDADLVITHLTGNYYVYTTFKPVNDYPFPSNSMYIVTDSGVVMIDTPWDVSQTEPLLDSIQRKHGKPVIMCIATHSHDDRTAGLEILRSHGVKTYSSEQTWQLCKEKNEKQAEFYFRRDTTFVAGELSFRTFYPGEGHTKDNIVIWFPKEKVLYGGCFIKSTESGGLGNIADANVADWDKSIKKVIQRFPKPRFIITGHQDWSSTGSLQHTLRLVKAAKKK